MILHNVLTDRQVTHEVRAVLGPDADDFDIEGIVDELRERFGPFGVTDKLDVEHSDFWKLVERHDLVNVPPHRST
jgi:hypothetical protein